MSAWREIPATAALFDSRHNPLWRLPLSADGARALVEFWQRIDPDTGRVTHDFLDEALDTRFLGDLYQDCRSQCANGTRYFRRQDLSPRSSWTGP